VLYSRGPANILLKRGEFPNRGERKTRPLILRGKKGKKLKGGSYCRKRRNFNRAKGWGATKGGMWDPWGGGGGRARSQHEGVKKSRKGEGRRRNEKGLGRKPSGGTTGEKKGGKIMILGTPTF